MHIVKCRFINCQSMTDKELIFASGLNVLLADNSSGKSVFFKMLKASCGVKVFSVEDLEHLITYGEDVAIALFYMSDGSVGGVKVARRDIAYIYGDSDSDLGVFSEPHPKFIRDMSIIVDPKSDFILNVLDPDQELIFVNSKPTTNYTVVKMVSSHEKLEQLIVNSEIVREKLIDQLKYAQSELDSVRNELVGFKYVDMSGVKERIDACSDLTAFCRILCNVYDSCDRLKFASQFDVEGLLSCLDYAADLNEICGFISCVKFVGEHDWFVLESFLDLCRELLDVGDCVESLEKSCNYLREVGEVVEASRAGLSKLVKTVECPVKGTVFYFEDASCLVCD